MTNPFPMTLTWAQLAELPDAADCFSWDDTYDETLEDIIAQYSDAFTSSEKLSVYLGMIGYELTFSTPTDGGTAMSTGITIRNESALHTANALFGQIMAEYDDPDCPRITETRTYGDTWPDMAGKTYEWSSTPTWAMFDLGGDDDVDYCGSQPSCLTDLLIRHLNMGTEA